MAGQTATMEFPVSINAQISNLKDLRATLINTLNAAGKDSSLAKTLTKDLAKVNQLISEAEEFTLSPTIDAAGLKALEGTFNKFFRQMQTSLQTIDLASFEQMASADDIARLKELTAEAAKYRRELEAINKSGSAEQTGKVLERTGNQDIAKRGSAYKEFNTTATLNKNAAAMGKAADAYAQQAAAMQAGIDKLAQELSQAEANSEKAKNKAKILEQNLAAVNIDTRAADFHHKAGRFATNYSAEQNVKNPTLDTIQSGLRATLESVYAGGKIATDMRATVKDWIKNLLPDVKDVDADNMVKKSVNDLLEDLMEGIFGSDYRSNPNLSYNVHHARILGNAQSYSAREIGRINAQYGISGGQDLKVISADISRELKQVRAEEREYSSEVDKTRTSRDEATNRQKEFTEAAAGARQLANELENLAKAEQEAARAAKEAQIEENEQNQLDLKNARASGVKNSGAPGRQKMGDYKTDAKEVFDDAGEVLGGKQAQIDEAAQFTANLKQSIKSWMSVQQIINIVKQGIRQAYQDIQGLDKAMTNIAVVTDMSVGDLWGKINEYMSIAQQYGVSTQGVYEVSQLYYQQGLGTADVMAATTETLKMARIAGMDYAEAADAMTVAIRSFKMEMSDAAHVTDVYSKVAAVTASDSEELAIAMSKTASSAESVGSSFENTTAMLAVMIETTRESAQNLGSALKSIISRYGEMKVGSTVDADGEVLDYNKVDTALKSVGISLKDTQGQFREFDDVIFELSAKWDSLDSVTQRYIATIMAGNRQQSRFIALVDNWERLDEVAGAAQDSEDAGLLQYAKTLDSLETKITNIKTSFQEFYMSLVNGPVVGAALEGINNILKGFNKLGNWQAILNIAGFIRSVKSIAKLLVSTISPSFSSIVTDYKSVMSEIVNAARQAGYDSAKAFQEGQNAAQNGAPLPAGGTGTAPTQKQSWFQRGMIGDKSGKVTWSSWNGNKLGSAVQIGGQLIGAAASIVGSSVAKDNQRAGAVISGVGNIAQGASMGAALGPWGAVIGGVIGGLASLPAVLDAFDPASVLQEKLEKAEEALSEANIERATKREEARNLEATINNLEKLQKARYSSEEAEQAFIDASNAAFEQFPQLTATFDEAGNAIIDVINNSAEAEYLLVEARKQAAEATVAAASAELKVAQTKLEQSNLELNQGAKALSKKTLQTGQHYSGTLAKAFDEMKEDTIMAAGYGKDWWNYSKAVYGKSSIMSTEGRDWNAPGYQFEREIEAANTVSDLVRIYQRGQKQVASGEDTTGGIALVLKKVDEVMEKAIEGESSEGTWMERYLLQLQENEQLQKSVRAGQKAVGYAYTNQLITNADPLNEANWKKINNSSSFLQKWVYEQAQLTDGDFVDGELTSDAMARVSQLFQSTLVDYESFFTSLGYQFEDFNNVIASASKGTLSSATLLDQFQALFGSDMSTWGSVVEQYWLTISGDIESNITRLKEDLESNRAYDWSSYIKGEEYQQAIQSLPIAYFSQISEFADDIDTRLQSGALTNTQAEKIIKEYFKTLNALTSDTLGLTSSQLSEAQQLLTEAASNGSLFSITGIQELITQLANAGIDIEELDLDQFPVYTANLITEWASFEDKLVSNLTAATEAMQKASEGMTLEEATSLANRIDLDLTTDFEFIDGKWFTTNIQAIKAYYTAQTNAIKEKFNEQVGKLLGTDTSSGLFEGITEQTLNDLKGKKTVESLGENATEEQIALWQAVQTYWDQEHYQTWVANTKKEAGEDADTSLATYWAEYFTNLGQTIETATAEALEYWTNESQKQAEAATRLAALKSQSQVQADKISAYETIASQGAKGYSPEDLNTIIGALGWDSSHYVYDPRTGTYELTEKALNSIPLLYRNQILASIDAEVQAATQAIESLGGNIFDASDADYSEAFSYLVKAGFQGKDIKQGINYALMEAIIGDPDQLEDYIGRELAHKMGRDYTDEFATEFDQEITDSRENMVAAFKDNYIEQIKSYNDLVYKKIVGTATFEELEQLDDLAVDLNIDLDQFTGRLIDDLTIYAQAIIDNAYLSAEEKNKYLKETYRTGLGAQAYADTYGLDANTLTQDSADRIGALSNSTQTMLKAKNRMTLDQASEYAAALSNMIGIPWDVLKQSFLYNQSDSTYSYDFSAGMTGRDLQLKMLYDTAVASDNAEVQKALKGITNWTEFLAGGSDAWKKLANAAFESGEADFFSILGTPLKIYEQLVSAGNKAEAFAHEGKVQKYASSIQEFASGQETTLEELMNLYSELGLELSLSDAQRLIAQGPMAIAQNLESIVNAVGSDFTDADKAVIEEAMRKGTETLLETLASIIDRALEGTATFDDLLILAKNTGIDLSGKVRKSATGYGLTQTGALSVAAARANLTGDYRGEAASLLNQYSGTGRIFESEASIIAAETSVKNQLASLDEEIISLTTALNNTVDDAEGVVEQAAKDQKKLTKEEQKAILEQKELQKKQLSAEQQVLASAATQFKQAIAKEMIGFMNRDPFNGQAEDWDTAIQNYDNAKEAIKNIYNNKGKTDYKTAAQLIDYMGATKGWDEDTRQAYLQKVFDPEYTQNGETDFYKLMGSVFNVTGSPTEILQAMGLLMEEARVQQWNQLAQLQKDNNNWTKRYNNLIEQGTKIDTTKEVTTTTETITDENGQTVTTTKVNLDSLSAPILDVYENLGMTTDVIREMAETQYGTNWASKLTDAETRKKFYEQIEQRAAQFEADDSSGLSREEQFVSYMKGESAVATIEERLNNLDQQLQDLHVNETVMDPLIEGIDSAIAKAERLNALLYQNGMGNAWLSYYQESTKEGQPGTFMGTILTNESDISDTTSEANRQKKIKEYLGSAYNIPEGQVDTVINADSWIKSKEGKTTGVKFSWGGENYQYNFKTADSQEGTGYDPNEIKYTGNFDEVDKYLEKYQNVVGVYTLTTPDNFKQLITKQLEAIDAEIKAGRKTGETDDVFNKRIASLQAEQEALLKLQTDTNKRYPTQDNGTVQLKIEGVTSEDASKLSKLQEQLTALQNAGNVKLTITDAQGNPITDIGSIKTGQQITVTADVTESSAEGALTVQQLVDSANEIFGQLKSPEVSVKVQSLTQSDIDLVTNLTAALTNLNELNIEDIIINLPGGNDAAIAAKSIYDSLTAINGKNYSATMNLTVQTVDSKGNPIVLDENGFVINTKEVETLTGQVEDLTSYNEELITENTELNRQLAEESKKKALVDAQNAGLQEQLTASEAEIATLTESLSETETALTALEAEKTELQATNGELQTANAELETTNAALQTENTSLASNNSDLAEKNATLEETIAANDTTITALEAEKAELAATNGELQATNATLQETIAANNAAITALEAERDELKAQLAANSATNTATIDELSTKLATAEGEIARLTKENWALQGQLNAKGSSEKQSDTEEPDQKGTPQQTPTPLPTPQPGPTPPAQQTSESEVTMEAEEVVVTGDNGETQTEEVVITGINGETLNLNSQTNNTDILTLLQQSGISLADYYKFIREQNNPFGTGTQPIQTPSPVLPTNTPGPTSILTFNTEEAETQAATLVEEVNNQQATLTITGDSTQATDTANTAKTKIDSLRATMDIYGNFAGLMGADGLPIVDMMYTGNVNGIAYADGNVDKLIKGAHLAHKTLVGELGPELGVWDGQYHLLGRDGAEFVNMPSDAIVFNHRQTEGILKGQMGYRGKALAEGNITGPAYAGGLPQVWEQWKLDTYESYDSWVKDFLKPSGSKKINQTEIEDLEEWYNLLRKIAKLEAEINLVRAERENITDGHDYLKNIREEEALLHEQIAVQKLLIDYKKEQLQLERKSIEQNKFWSESLTFNEDGTLLSVFGNETNGGKGAFAFLDQLQELSGAAQVAAVQKLGYSYKGRDGKFLEGEELVKQFIEEYQEVVGDYNELDDSILEAETTIESLTTEINELEDTITENQKELEQSIYDLLVEAAELEIEQMEEENELLKEANEKYIQGLSDALTAEQSLYEKNESIEDRESLQRQLALLRRSGGSASEIESLEKQLNDTLKQEYFNNQQDMIEELTEANELQTELLERQVKLQEDALEYQKENGVLWTKVYEIMSGSYEDILAFFQGNSQEFFKASTLEQESMLLEWAKIIGIYDEDRAGQLMTAEAERQWENNEVLGNLTTEQQTNFSKLSDSDKTIAQKHYNAAYTSARLEGKSDEEARKAARDSMVERLRVDEDLGIVRWDPHGDGSGSGSGSSGSGERLYYGGYTTTNAFIGGSGCYADGYATAKSLAASKGIITSAGRDYFRTSYSPLSAWALSSGKKWYVVDKSGNKLSEGHSTQAGAASNRGNLIGAASRQLQSSKANGGDEATIAALTANEKKYKESTLKYFSQGGLVDYTGLAVVHGSQSKPEAFLNASQTAQITEALRETTGKESVLEGLRSTMDKLRALVHNISAIDNSNNQNISIAPGAVVIQVEQLADSYDIDEVSRDVMNRMVTIANKATNRGVNRR